MSGAAEKQKEIKWKIRATAIDRPPLAGFEPTGIKGMTHSAHLPMMVERLPATLTKAEMCL
jgi:hypothetical protein